MDNLPNRYMLRNRYVFEGELVLDTALHIGGGKFTLSASNNPIILTPENVPFIPGSSFKGALRSTVEKIVASLPADTGLTACGLPTQESTDEKACPTTRQSQITKMRRNRPIEDVRAIMDSVRENLCNTCHLFGSPFTAAHIVVDDLYLEEDEWSGVIQLRDGVAIDRDSETAKNSLKYDFEVVPSKTVFRLRIILENATQADLQLISIGLNEFAQGFGGVGGKRSRGLGACKLVGLTIRALDLEIADEDERRTRLQRYLVKHELSEVDDAEKFLEEHIDSIFESPANQERSK